MAKSRFTAEQIILMLREAGSQNVFFSLYQNHFDV
jgi:hypothetical protein